MTSDKSALVRLTNRLGFAQIHTMSDSLRREERFRFTARELHHRNKNLLAVVQAIANQIGSRSLSLKDYQEQFSQRLQGLSRSLDLLVEEDGCGVWMADLVRSQLQPFGEVDGVRVAATGPAILLQPTPPRTLAWLCTSWRRMRSSTARFQSPKARSPYTGTSAPTRR
jgi:two-component sensor histidine kinase